MTETTITVSPRTLFQLDDRLFGQMLERASWGEPGPEGALVPGTNRLQPSVVQRMKEMRIPVLRFPGGTDTDYLDWCDLVSNVPGRGADRPVSSIGSQGGTITTRFGYDEFLQLCEDLPSRPLIVVNFQYGLMRRKPLAEAARHAAALVAYCNAAVDASRLEEAMRVWPAAREKNGRKDPYHVPLFQIGNETWCTWGGIEKMGMTRKEAVDWYVTCLEAYVDAMRSVDPSIEIIVDGSPLDELLPTIKNRLGTKIDYIVPEHVYWPFGSYTDFSRDGKAVDTGTLSAEEIWNTWVSVPVIDSNTGMSTLQAPFYSKVRASGYKVAITEWNWNGWGSNKTIALESGLARGLAAAGILHAIMREGATVKLATQSLCVGEGWKGIVSIWADPSGNTPAYLQPTGQAVQFINHYHGNDMLDVSTSGIPHYQQPYSLCGLPVPQAPVASLDVLATADKDTVYVHVINRNLTADVPISIDLSAFPAIGRKAIEHCYVGRLNDKPAPGEKAEEIVRFVDTTIHITGNTLHVTLPQHSMTIIEIPVKRR